MNQEHGGAGFGRHQRTWFIATLVAGAGLIVALATVLLVPWWWVQPAEPTFGPAAVGTEQLDEVALPPWFRDRDTGREILGRAPDRVEATPTETPPAETPADGVSPEVRGEEAGRHGVRIQSAPPAASKDSHAGDPSAAPVSSTPAGAHESPPQVSDDKGSAPAPSAAAAAEEPSAPASPVDPPAAALPPEPPLVVPSLLEPPLVEPPLVERMPDPIDQAGQPVGDTVDVSDVAGDVKEKGITLTDELKPVAEGLELGEEVAGPEGDLDFVAELAQVDLDPSETVDALPGSGSLPST